jgi:hypothetical protein
MADSREKYNNQAGQLRLPGRQQKIAASHSRKKTAPLQG